ncbi:hypothetical protein R1flu_002731 [Riccia fluitans]|uniref:DNA repair and recombination protein RAD54 n=1 Tax=Riccia fluitans TaxID=41844 RepID=A0ABD1Y709_9MARC
MRISGAPSVIRKQASSTNKVLNSANLHQKQRKFSTPIRETGALQPLQNNRTLGPQCSATADDSLNSKVGSITTSKNLIPGVEELDQEVITVEDDDDPKPAEGNEQRGNSDTKSLPNKKHGLGTPGGTSGRKKARLGVGPMKLGFKPPALAGARTSSLIQLDSSTSVLPSDPMDSSPGSSKQKSVGFGRDSAGDEPSSSYYYVMYCTRKLNAKHKGPWSDGVLISRGRSCVLKDTEGKVVTKDSCHRCGDMSEGATFPLGKFEVEIMKNSTEEEFLSGKIFSATVDLEVDNLTNTMIKRSFKRPVLSRSSKGGAAFASSDLSSTVKDDALLLNAREVQRGAKPVVVDPYLACKLRQHQQEGVKFMYECVMGIRSHKFTGCLLADAMGLGKTLQVIALLWTLLHQVKRKTSTFQIGKVSPVLVTSYELLRKYNNDLVSAKPDLLVCDEAHRLKNCAGNKTIDALLALKCPMKILLTGTPVQNDLMEFYAMLDFANKDLLGPVSTFKRLYADPIEKSRDRNASEEEKNLGRKRSEELQRRTRPYILQRSSNVNLMYLPVKTELVVFCKLQAPQISLYQKFLRSKTVEALLHTSSQSAVILSAIGTLRKLCNHPKLVHEEVTSEKRQRSPSRSHGPSAPSEITSQNDWTLSGKLNCLYKIMSAVHLSKSSGTADKIIVVSNFTQTLNIIENLCRTKRWKWLRLDGSTEVSDRQTKVDRFNGGYGEEWVFLLSSKAGGSGLNLVGANRLVLFDPDWNPATDAQAMARVWRDGQKKPVLIYRLLSTGSIEEKIYQRQIMKQEVAAAVGEGGRSGHSGHHFSREELRELFSLNLDTRCDTHDLLSRSLVRQTQRWRDYSHELQDYALQEAIETGVITFVHKETDTRPPDFSTGNDSASKLSEGDNHRSLLCALSREASSGVRESRRLSQSDGQVPGSMDFYEPELDEDRKQNYHEECYMPGSEQNDPILLRTELDDFKDQGISLADSSTQDVAKSTNTEVQSSERSNEDPAILELPPRTVENPYPSYPPSRKRVCFGEKYFEESDASKSKLQEFHLDETAACFQNNLSLDITSQSEKDEFTTSMSGIEASTICQSESQCCCLLGRKGHKLLNHMLENLRPVPSDLDDLEALDTPFLSSMELELELQRAEFSPKKLWEVFKLFVSGFLLGAKQEQIFYSCSTLGLILDKCNGDKTSTTESTFCKGLPLVISALRRQHGPDSVKLHTLMSLHEDKEQLMLTPVGRLLSELTRRCDFIDDDFNREINCHPLENERTGTARIRNPNVEGSPLQDQDQRRVADIPASNLPVEGCEITEQSGKIGRNSKSVTFSSHMIRPLIERAIEICRSIEEDTSYYRRPDVKKQ